MNEESAPKRLERNLNELLQELRVATAGVQILFAFLLSVSFTEVFERANDFQRWTYLITVLLTMLSAAMLIAPAAWHRVLFRQGRREQIVNRATLFAVIGLALLAAAMTGTVVLVVDVMFGELPALLIGAGAGLVFALLWFAVPVWDLRHEPAPEPLEDPAP